MNSELWLDHNITGSNKHGKSAKDIRFTDLVKLLDMAETASDPPSPEVLIHPSSRGSLGRRGALVARKLRKEELNRASPAREGEARMPAREADRLVSAAGKGSVLRLSATPMNVNVRSVQTRHLFVLVQTNVLISVHLGSGELIWGTLEICFLYIGHDNSSLDILQWLPARYVSLCIIHAMGFLVAAIPRGYSRGNLAPNVNSMLFGDE
uniref:Uncharacterized protein n=1 Tax=Aegilops tauschii TaxID=37682 RepID=M8B6K4_AEGTA